MSKRKTNFEDSAELNRRSYLMYFNKIKSLAVSRFKWEGLPETVDPRYLETVLFEHGSVIYFNDPAIGDLCLTCIMNGNFDVYGYPIDRRAYSRYNNYQRTLTNRDSVIIYNNYQRLPDQMDAEMFARRLANLDRIIDVNANAQKTPVLIQGSEKERLTLRNVYKEYDGNSPVLFGTDSLNLKGLTILRTDAPYVSDKLFTLKTQIWNECLAWLGIESVDAIKKDRLITAEIEQGNGSTVASRYNALLARREAAEKINEMFGTSITVHFQNDEEFDETAATEDQPGGGVKIEQIHD